MYIYISVRYVSCVRPRDRVAHRCVFADDNLSAGPNVTLRTCIEHVIYRVTVLSGCYLFFNRALRAGGEGTRYTFTVRNAEPVCRHTPDIQLLCSKLNTRSHVFTLDYGNPQHCTRYSIASIQL